MQEVVIKDIQMKFGSMIWFMVKWAVASIPAILIVWGLVALCASMFFGIVTLWEHGLYGPYR